MKSKIWKQFTKYVLPVLALAIAIPLAAACIGTEGKTRVLADTPALEMGENIVPFVHDEVVEYSFTPSESGYYTFWSEGNYDPMVTLAGENLSVSDDDKGENRNFRLTVNLSAGETYQISFGLLDEIEGSVNIVVNVKKGLDCTSGTCGDDATWSFDEETAVLTISGTGAMYDFDETDEPWEDIKQFIESVIIGDDITHIGYSAFDSSENLSSLTIGSGVTSVGESAFLDCTSLTEVVIPNNVTSISNSAFEGCENISNLTIGTGVTSIGESAFWDCKGLTEVVIPNNVTSIGNSAFQGCENISSLTIGSGVTSIGEYAFYGCKGLTEVVIPNNVTSIGKSAFRGCEKIASLTIGSGVTSIGEYAFYGCTGISSLTIGSGVTSIGEYAFYGCKGLTEVVIPNNVTSIGNLAFEGCENISSLTIGTGVTSIGEYAFWDCKGLTEVVIPNNVTSIGKSAFRDCRNISSLTIGSGVTSIGESAFYGCTGISSLTIGSGVTSIGESAFRGCTNLTAVVIPNNVTSIGNSAFYMCKNMSSLTIGSGVTSIGESAFRGCTSLTEVVIPGSVAEISQEAFLSCSNITNVYCYADPEKLSWTDGNCDDFSGNRGAKSTKCHVFPEYLPTYKDKFDSEVNVEFVGDLSHDVDLGLGGTLYGYSLSLEGDIGVKFYMDLTGVDLSSNPYMEFTVPNGSKAEKQTVTLEDAETVVMAEKTYYTFKCRISAKDASSIIQAQMFAGEEKSEVYAFSVKSYAEYIISHRTDDQYARSAPLAEALLSYCTCAQSYFGTNPSKLDATCIDQSALDQVTKDSMAVDLPATPINIGNLSGVTFEGATLSLKSETTLSLYFSSAEDLTFRADEGVEIVPDSVGPYKVVRIRGIHAANIGDSFTVTVTNSSGESGTVKYSVLNYCYNVVAGPYGDDLKNVVKSLYLYYEAAKAYTP